MIHERNEHDIRVAFMRWWNIFIQLLPTANLTIYQKGVYYSGIKIYNHLPTAIKDFV
jgi:hypothetical protein